MGEDQRISIEKGIYKTESNVQQKTENTISGTEWVTDQGANQLISEQVNTMYKLKQS